MKFYLQKMDMELRWLNGVLQYRTQELSAHEGWYWKDWQEVPVVTANAPDAQQP